MAGPTCQRRPDAPSELLGGSGDASLQEGIGTRAKYGMRYRDLTEARPWKKFMGRSRTCLISNNPPDPKTIGLVVEAEGHWGTVWTGRSEVFWGYFVRIVGRAGEEWLGEDRGSLVAALVAANDAASASGWSVLALGLTDEWTESGLSANSGYGYHPAFDRHVHMLEPSQDRRQATS